MIPYGRQFLRESDIDAVISALSSDFLTQGPKVFEFEAKIATYVGAKYAVAVNSATSALHLSYLALGLQKNDLVWTSPITFAATSNAALLCGAEVDFVDINPETFNICDEKLRLKLEAARNTGQPLPKIVTVVHMAGLPAEVEKIYQLSKEFGFFIVEDASHALGSSTNFIKTGSCQYSDITVFSFHAVKMITTGEGGCCVTNSEELANIIARLRSHGITRNPAEMAYEFHGPWYYEQLDLGLNYRITDFQCALGMSQLTHLEEFVQRRNEIADWYDSELSSNPNIILPKVPQDRLSSFHLYIIRVSDPRYRKGLFESLRAQGILVNVHYLPVYRHPY
jgi:UDP-4-amino-4,6-dideoxy-N-acetyl-beta-L-altrosamine transaminase